MKNSQIKEMPTSPPFFRRREQHTECIVYPKPNNEYLICFVNASIDGKSGHKIYVDEPSFYPYDSPMIKKAAIIAVENYISSGNTQAVFCMGGLTCQFDETYDPKYVFISNDDDEFISSFFIYVKNT
jgi:hypothetical protein